MGIGEKVFKELVKNGYSIRDGTRVWDVARRDLLYMTPDLSKAFLELRENERYKANLIDKETQLIKENISKVCDIVGDDSFNLIDVGCGDGLKAGSFIQAVGDKAKIRFCPVSTSDELVALALKNIQEKEYSNVTDCNGHVRSFGDLDEVIAQSRTSEYQKNVVLLLGSLISSFDINGYLRSISDAMFPGDVLIIGNGVRKGKRFTNVDTYKSPEFNNWFVNLVKELGFKDDEVEYDVRFDNNRLEGFYKIKVDKKISFDGIERDFRKGDEILAAYQHKYFDNELSDFCGMYFSKVELIKDPESEYALIICKK